jgi:hypothetical protein
MGKYEPLGRFLKSLDRPRWRASFAEIEAILSFKLPDSAFKYPAWWSNDATGHSHARAWLDAGWRTAEVDVTARKVTLVRSEGQSGVIKRDPWGCMAGTVRVVPGTDLTAPSGETWTAEHTRLTRE